jgi:hypothetical protein
VRPGIDVVTLSRFDEGSASGDALQDALRGLWQHAARAPRCVLQRVQAIVPATTATAATAATIIMTTRSTAA